MGKSKRDEYWHNNEQLADRVEKIRAKPLKDDKAKAWRKACADYLMVNHFCYDCQKRGYTSPALHVAHIESPDQQVKFWNIDNWQALCEPCNQRITEGKEIQILEPIPKNLNLYMVK